MTTEFGHEDDHLGRTFLYVIGVDLEGSQVGLPKLLLPALLRQPFPCRSDVVRLE
jgi:hypothetical protein